MLKVFFKYVTLESHSYDCLLDHLRVVFTLEHFLFGSFSSFTAFWVGIVTKLSDKGRQS